MESHLSNIKWYPLRVTRIFCKNYSILPTYSLNIFLWKTNVLKAHKNWIFISVLITWFFSLFLCDNWHFLTEKSFIISYQTIYSLFILCRRLKYKCNNVNYFNSEILLIFNIRQLLFHYSFYLFNSTRSLDKIEVKTDNSFS